MLRAVIIDDEPSNRNALKQKLLRHCPAVTVIGECENGEEGIALLSTTECDVVFLDVEMPRMNGFNMLQNLRDINFEVIFITAYDQYAIRAIKVSALDYLVKPVEVEDLKIAVQKAEEKRIHTSGNERLEQLLANLVHGKKELYRLAIPSMGGVQFVETENIIYLEASRNYTCFYITGQPRITVAKTLKEFEDLLPGSVFIRIHHSYIINKNMVVKYIKGEGGQVIMKNNKVLDVSRRKKELFMKAMEY